MEPERWVGKVTWLVRSNTARKELKARCIPRSFRSPRMITLSQRWVVRRWSRFSLRKSITEAFVKRVYSSLYTVSHDHLYWTFLPWVFRAPRGWSCSVSPRWVKSYSKSPGSICVSLTQESSCSLPSKDNFYYYLRNTRWTLHFLSCMTTCCFLTEGQSSSYLRIFPAMPCHFNLFSNRSWGTLSNAFWKSR